MSNQNKQLEDCVKICEEIILNNLSKEWDQFTRELYDPVAIKKTKKDNKDDKRIYKFRDFKVNHFMVAIISMNLFSIGTYESKKQNTRQDK